MKNKKIVLVSPEVILENPVSKNIYGIPENYETIKANIIEMGILEPLIIGEDNVVISGNLRRKIAIEIGLDLIPVIYSTSSEKDEKLVTISHAQQRIKKYSEILKELEIMSQHYGIRRGIRTDLDSKKRKNKKTIQETIGLSSTKISKLKAIKKMAIELYGEKSEKYNSIWKSLDEETKSLNNVYEYLNSEKKKLENKTKVSQKFEINNEKVKVFNKPCSSMDEVETNSISCIMTSPPYYRMRDYGTGKNQLGQEKDINSFINNLVNSLDDCKRVLKEDGSLWVNINDCVGKSGYTAVGHYFVVKMIEKGWFYNDEIIWIKDNPMYTHGKRSVRNHEYIFHFTKSKNFYYDDSWLKDMKGERLHFSNGQDNNVPKLLSGMDFRDNVLKTGASNTGGLRKKCLETKEFHLTHSATFPIQVPTIAILCTSKKGDTILDCFSGTATTGESAILLERNYIGYETNPEFIQASEVRLSQYIETNYSFRMVA